MLNGAIIGFGKIAQQSHIKAFLNDSIKQKLKITSVVEPDKENLKKASAEFPSIKFYSSLEKLFEKESINFVDIAAPPNLHAEIINKCLEKKLHIICEKPFTLNLNDAEIISKKLKKSETNFIPCHQYKYAGLWKEFKSLIDNPSGKSKYIFQCSVFRTEADFGLPIFNNPWRIKKNISGGGILTDTGIHYLYLSRWLLGKPKKITAKIYNLNHSDYEVEDTANILIESEKGISEITLTWAANKRVNSAKLISDKVSLIYEGGNKLVKYSNDKEETINVPDVSDKSTYNKLYVSLFDKFYNNVKTKSNSLMHIEEAFESIKLLEKCYRSAKEGKTINLEN